MNRYHAWLLTGITVANAFATPVYYTFTGKVTEVSRSERTSLHLGDDVFYVFLVDRDLQGAMIHHDQVVDLLDDPESGQDCFYAEYIDGSTQAVLPFEGDSFYSGTESQADGFANVVLRGSEDFTDGISLNSRIWNRVSISAPDRLDSWAIGKDDFIGATAFFDFTPEDGSFLVTQGSRLTLTAISDSSPMVPEPGSFCLACLGLMSVFLFAVLPTGSGRKCPPGSAPLPRPS
jgi:hypothetical protein